MTQDGRGGGNGVPTPACEGRRFTADCKGKRPDRGPSKCFLTVLSSQAYKNLR